MKIFPKEKITSKKVLIYVFSVLFALIILPPITKYLTVYILFAIDKKTMVNIKKSTLLPIIKNGDKVIVNRDKKVWENTLRINDIIEPVA